MTEDSILTKEDLEKWDKEDEDICEVFDISKVKFHIIDDKDSIYQRKKDKE